MSLSFLHSDYNILSSTGRLLFCAMLSSCVTPSKEMRDAFCKDVGSFEAWVLPAPKMQRRMLRRLPSLIESLRRTMARLVMDVFVGCHESFVEKCKALRKCAGAKAIVYDSRSAPLGRRSESKPRGKRGADTSKRSTAGCDERWSDCWTKRASIATKRPNFDSGKDREEKHAQSTTLCRLDRSSGP